MRILRLVGVNLAAILAVLAVAEALFGSWFSGETLGALSVPRLVERRFDTADLYPGGGTITFRRDRYGLRGEYGRPEDVAVLTIGGSTTNERYVDEGRTWTDVLAAEFARAGQNIRIANGGAEGQSTIGHLRSLENWYPHIPGLRPRWVIAYIGINDQHLRNPDNAAYDRTEASGALARGVQYLANHSALNRARLIIQGMLAARRVAVVHGGLDPKTLVWRDMDLPDPLPPLDPAVEGLRQSYGIRVGQLIRRIREFGAETVIVTQHRGTYRRDGGRLFLAEGGGLNGGLGDWAETTWFNRAAMEACRAEGAVCIDLGAEIEFRSGDFYDYVHTTPAGSQRVGEFLYSRLKGVIK